MIRLGGFPVLEWVAKRVMNSAVADVVVLALPQAVENDVLEKLGREIGCEVYRGSEIDVLQRLALSVEGFQPDTVVRVCADRPFVDPNVIDDTVRFFNRRVFEGYPLDIAFSHKGTNQQNWPYGFGVEVFSFASMQWLNRSVKNDFEREHVTLHMWNNAEKFKIEALPCPSVYSRLKLGYKLDLDTTEDLAKLRELVVDMEDITLPGQVFVDRAVKLEKLY